MNSHQRRTTARYWRYAAYVEEYPGSYDTVTIRWLHANFGLPTFKSRRIPRWVWRPAYTATGNFSQYISGIEIFFRKKEDYSWFLLKWGDNE